MTPNASVAVNRFGLGAQPGELDAVAEDPRGWLLAQARGRPAIYSEFDRLLPTSEAIKLFPRFAQRILRERPAPGENTGVEQKFRDIFLPVLRDEVAARMKVAGTTRAPFQERLVWFWANHFTVSGTKPAAFALAGPFEREAIRPNVNARFQDLLLASTRHPAMIVYLDNHLSVAPGRTVRSFGRQLTGLNENLAREILELHTLGVDAGYTQQDVTAFARVLTGWTVGNRFKPGFVFDEDRHDRNEQTLLGKRYAQRGVAQGEAVLRDLAAHPATAHHIATKLACHFIADDPPSAAVERIAKAFLDSRGDLPAVYAALVDSPEAWQRTLPKVKQPVEFVASTLRAIPAAREARAEALLFSLNQLGQRPFSAPSPAGWPDGADAWVGADALWKRIEWSHTVAQRLGNSVDPLALAHATYRDLVSERTLRIVSRAESPQQGLALWLASPEFQRR